MHKAQLVWLFAVVAAVMLGVTQGGPRAVADVDVVGADPVKADCNGNASLSQDCPDVASGSNCNNNQKYDVIRDELSGAVLRVRYDNDQLRCTTNFNSPCKHYSLKSSESCTEKTKPSDAP